MANSGCLTTRKLHDVNIVNYLLMPQEQKHHIQVTAGGWHICSPGVFCMENISIQVTTRKDDAIVIDINNRCRHLEISAKIVFPSVPSHGVILFHIHSEKKRWQHTVNLLKKTDLCLQPFCHIHAGMKVIAVRTEFLKHSVVVPYLTSQIFSRTKETPKVKSLPNHSVYSISPQKSTSPDINLVCSRPERSIISWRVLVWLEIW